MVKGPDWQDAQVVFKTALREAYTELVASKDPLWLAADEKVRVHLVRLIAENQMVAAGYVPSSWRYRGICKRCGEVPLEAEVDEELIGCPWCAVGSKPSVYSFV